MRCFYVLITKIVLLLTLTGCAAGHGDFVNFQNDRIGKKMPYKKGVTNIGYKEFTILTKDPDNVYRVSPKNDSTEGLAVTILHTKVFGEIIDEDFLFTKFLDEAVSLVQSGEYEIAFILPELRASDIFDVVLTGDRMPQKTTYFYPKILSGLVFNPLA